LRFGYLWLAGIVGLVWKTSLSLVGFMKFRAFCWLALKLLLRVKFYGSFLVELDGNFEFSFRGQIELPIAWRPYQASSLIIHSLVQGSKDTGGTCGFTYGDNRKPPVRRR
jgi:hypothetical protein